MYKNKNFIALEKAKEMAHFLFFKSQILLLAVAVSLPVELWASEIDDCYGDTLEVQIYMFSPQEDDSGEVILALPNPASWSLVGRDGQGSLRDAGCLEEPVPVNQVYSSGMLNKFAAALYSIGAPDALEHMVSLSISGGKKDAPQETFYDEYFREDEWVSIPHGYGRLDSKGDELVMSYYGRTFAVGTIRFPKNYRTPLDQAVVTSCSSFGFCAVNYFLHKRLRIKYKFRSTVEYYENWIPQDQALRALIDSWVIGKSTDTMD